MRANCLLSLLSFALALSFSSIGWAHPLPRKGHRQKACLVAKVKRCSLASPVIFKYTKKRLRARRKLTRQVTIMASGGWRSWSRWKGISRGCLSYRKIRRLRRMIRRTEFRFIRTRYRCRAIPRYHNAIRTRGGKLFAYRSPCGSPTHTSVDKLLEKVFSLTKVTGKRHRRLHPRQLCLSRGGRWIQFRNGCRQRCYAERRRMVGRPVRCTMGMPMGCYCGRGKCWTGKRCVRTRKRARRKRLTPRKLCISRGGRWTRFSNGCRQRCYSERRRKAGQPVPCTTALTMGCYCGRGKCWTGKRCIKTP